MSAIYPNPTDVLTLKPFMEQLEEQLPFKFQRVAADAGYESEENLKFLEEKEIEAYIKPADYEQRGTKKLRSKLVTNPIWNTFQRKTATFAITENA